MKQVIITTAAAMCGALAVADLIVNRYLNKVENLSQSAQTKSHLIWRFFVGRKCANCIWSHQCYTDQSKCFCSHPDMDGAKVNRQYKCRNWL